MAGWGQEQGVRMGPGGAGLGREQGEWGECHLIQLWAS